MIIARSSTPVTAAGGRPGRRGGPIPALALRRRTGGRENRLVLLPSRATRWVLEVIGPGSRVCSTRWLRLGGWHVDHALDVLDGRGRTHRLVLRRWARPGWEADDPDYTVEREVAVLELLGSTPVPAPVVVAADPAGAQCDVPAILLTRLPGHPPRPAEVSGARFCSDLAEALAQIHAVDATRARRLEPYRLYYDRTHAAPAAWMPATPVWAQAIAAVREPPPTTTSGTSITLIHRDYHPQNTLWSRQRLTAVVDWTQASSGPPGLDLGHMRWNLLADHGQHVADQFLARYRATTGNACPDQPYWDLVSLLDLLLDGDDPGDIEPSDLKRFEEYAKTALAART
jgi:aminoglycoside phosphotransferase (APT) family kinase protein